MVARFGFLWLFLVATSSLYAVCDQIDPKVYANKYGLYRMPLGSGPVLNAIKEGRVWEATTLDYIAHHHPKETSIVHAGTYFGDMLPLFSQLVGAKGVVWAFEPVPLFYECAMDTVQLNGLPNVALYNAALSDRPASLWMRAGLGGGSKIDNDVANPKQAGLKEVQAVALDDLLGPDCGRIGTIHLDVEGYECIALQGALKTIAFHRPMVILEVWPEKYGEIGLFMSQLGYREVARVDHNAVYIPNEWPR